MCGCEGGAGGLGWMDKTVSDLGTSSLYVRLEVVSE